MPARDEFLKSGCNTHILPVRSRPRWNYTLLYAFAHQGSRNANPVDIPEHPHSRTFRATCCNAGKCSLQPYVCLLKLGYAAAAASSFSIPVKTLFKPRCPEHCTWPSSYRRNAPGRTQSRRTHPLPSFAPRHARLWQRGTVRNPI
jgi:hypothetical protein